MYSDEVMPIVDLFCSEIPLLEDVSPAPVVVIVGIMELALALAVILIPLPPLLWGRL